MDINSFVAGPYLKTLAYDSSQFTNPYESTVNQPRVDVARAQYNVDSDFLLKRVAWYNPFSWFDGEPEKSATDTIETRVDDKQNNSLYIGIALGVAIIVIGRYT